MPYLSAWRTDQLGVEEQDLAERLARHYLTNYFWGYFTMRFRPPYAHQGVVGRRQAAIEEAIRQLAEIEPARAVMAEWFTAALTGSLHRTVRQSLNRGGFTLSPLAWGLQAAGSIIFADDWEKLSWFKDDGYRAVEFGLGGYFLIFSESRSACFWKRSTV